MHCDVSRMCVSRMRVALREPQSLVKTGMRLGFDRLFKQGAGEWLHLPLLRTLLLGSMLFLTLMMACASKPWMATRLIRLRS